MKPTFAGKSNKGFTVPYQQSALVVPANGSDMESVTPQHSAIPLFHFRYVHIPLVPDSTTKSAILLPLIVTSPPKKAAPLILVVMSSAISTVFASSAYFPIPKAFIEPARCIYTFSVGSEIVVSPISPKVSTTCICTRYVDFTSRLPISAPVTISSLVAVVARIVVQEE